MRNLGVVLLWSVVGGYCLSSPALGWEWVADRDSAPRYLIDGPGAGCSRASLAAVSSRTVFSHGALHNPVLA